MPCPAGTAQSETNQPMCTPCPVGYYSGVAFIDYYPAAIGFKPADGQPHFSQIACGQDTEPNPAKTECVAGTTPTFPDSAGPAVVGPAQRVVDTGSVAGAALGTELKVKGNVMVVGAERGASPMDEAMTGAGYALVFTRPSKTDDWTLQARLYPSNRHQDHAFGISIDFTDDWIVIGATGADAAGVYVFAIPGGDVTSLVDGTETAYLQVADSATKQFGHALAISGDVIVASQYSDHTYVGYGGSIVVFVYNGTFWVFDQSLTASAFPLHYGSAQGGDLVFDGVTLVYSVSQTIQGQAAAGRVALWSRAGDGAWTETGYLDAPMPYMDAKFGIGIDLNGDTLAIAAMGDSQMGHHTGAVYVCTRTAVGANWTLQAKLVNPEAAADEELGVRRAVALDGDVLAVGNYRHHQYATNGGAVLLFRRTGTDWRLDAELTGLDGPIKNFGFTFGPASTPAQTVIDAEDLVIVPVVDLTPTPTDLGTIPQGSYPLAITFPDASTITTTVDLQAPYTIPLPTMVLDGTTIQGRVASSICPANIPVAGQTKALNSAKMVEGAVVCVSENRTITGADIKAGFPAKIDKTHVSGDDEVCVSLTGVTFASTAAVVVTLNAHPQMGVSAKHGAVCTIFAFTEGNSVAADAVLNSWEYKIFVYGTELFATTLTGPECPFTCTCSSGWRPSRCC